MGHGHVIPNEDGSKARCGGPLICKECALEFTQQKNRLPRSLANDQRKQSLYFPGDMLEEIKAEAKRLDRSWSFVVQMAWRIAYLRIKAHPGPKQLIEELKPLPPRTDGQPPEE